MRELSTVVVHGGNTHYITQKSSVTTIYTLHLLNHSNIIKLKNNKDMVTFNLVINMKNYVSVHTRVANMYHSCNSNSAIHASGFYGGY